MSKPLQNCTTSLGHKKDHDPMRPFHVPVFPPTARRHIQLALLLLWLTALTIGCTADKPRADDGPIPVVLMLNWFPEAEHGGFYAAQVHGIFEQYGLDVEIRPGGPNAPVAQELITGRVEFAIGNADDVLLFRNQGAPVVALLAPIQNTPRCILVRADSGVTDLAGLSGMTLQAGAGRPYLEFMRAKGLLEGVQVVPYSGSVAKLVSDQNTAIQAYSFSEPFMAEQQGVAVRTLMLSDVGFNPYASCLLTTEETIADRRELVGRMVAACQAGWQKYLQAPEESNAAILAANPQGMTAEALQFGVAALQPLCQPQGLPGDSIGTMRLERWTELIDQFEQLQLISPSKVQPESVFTTEFLAPAANQPDA